MGCATLTPTMKSVAGAYEGKRLDGVPDRAVFHNNGVVEFLTHGGKEHEKYTWKIVGREIHGGGGGDLDDIVFFVIRINPDGSLTVVAGREDRKLKDYPKEEQYTYKKIK